jgi:hypothetical protein
MVETNVPSSGGMLLVIQSFFWGLGSDSMGASGGGVRSNSIRSETTRLHSPRQSLKCAQFEDYWPVVQIKNRPMSWTRKSLRLRLVDDQTYNCKHRMGDHVCLAASPLVRPRWRNEARSQCHSMGRKFKPYHYPISRSTTYADSPSRGTGRLE